MTKVNEMGIVDAMSIVDSVSWYHFPKWPFLLRLRRSQKVSILWKRPQKAVFAKSDRFELFALFHFFRKSWNRGVFSKNLTSLFAFLTKSAFFDHFCKNRRIRQNTRFWHFWRFWRKVHFWTILGVPDDSGLFFSIFGFLWVGNPDFGSQIIRSRGPNDQIWTFQGSSKSDEIVEKVTFCHVKKWRFCQKWRFWRF